MLKFFFYPNFDSNIKNSNNKFFTYGLTTEGKQYESSIKYLDLFRDYVSQAYSLNTDKISVHRWNRLLFLFIRNDIPIEDVSFTLEFAKLDVSLLWHKISKKGRLFPLILENGKGSKYTRCRIPIPEDAIVTSTHPTIYRLQILLKDRWQEAHFFISLENYELNDCLGFFFRKFYHMQKQIRGILFDIPTIFQKDNILHNNKRGIDSILVDDVGSSQKYIRTENNKVSINVNIHTTTSLQVVDDIDLNYQSEEELLVPF